jgi:competence protein ComEC
MDHVGGSQSLIEQKTVNDIQSSIVSLSSSQTCSADQSWTWDGVDFLFLNPASGHVASENNLSCVLKISTGDQSVLLTGDIEIEAEQHLVSRYPKQLASTILVAPHHGSNTSSSQVFIDAVDPDFVLFPVGYENRWHFPNEDVIRRYRQHGSQLLDNVSDGAILIKVNPSQIQSIVRWRQTNQNIWTHHHITTD